MNRWLKNKAVYHIVHLTWPTRRFLNWFALLFLSTERDLYERKSMRRKASNSVCKWGLLVDQKSFGLRAKKGQIVRRGYFGGDFVHMRTNYWGARDHVLLGRFLCYAFFLRKQKWIFFLRKRKGCVFLTTCTKRLFQVLLLFLLFLLNCQKVNMHFVPKTILKLMS